MSQQTMERRLPARAPVAIRPGPGSPGPGRPSRTLTGSWAAHDGPSQRPAPAATRLVGRAPELARVVELAMRANRGRGGAMLVEGEPGIGKTTLLDAAATECERLGVRVFRGTAQELERRFSFAAIDSCLGTSFSSQGVPVAPSPTSDPAAGQPAMMAATGPQHELATAEAATSLLREYCAAGPVALLLDDLQWADGSTLLLLSRLGRLLGELPLALFLACGPIPRSEQLQRLFAGLIDRGRSPCRSGRWSRTRCRRSCSS